MNQLNIVTPKLSIQATGSSADQLAATISMIAILVAGVHIYNQLSS